MTISSAVSRMDYTGNGATTIYPYTFKIVDQTHLVVTKSVLGVESTLVLNTDYTVSGVGAQAGGNVTLAAVLANGVPLVIRRVVPVLQTTDLKNQGSFYPEVHENEFDAVVMMVQQQQEEINRAVKVPITGGPTPETYLASLSSFITAFLNGIADVAAAIHAAGSKATPVDADELGIYDSVSGLLKKLTWANLKTTLGSTFAALAGSSSQAFSVGTATSAAHAVRLDQMHADFAAGTRMPFNQTAAPTGWTKDTTAALNDTAMRIVTGTVGSGGSVAFTTAMVSHTATISGSVAGYTLQTADIPSHTHGIGTNVSNIGTTPYVPQGSNYANSRTCTSDATGGGGSHAHGVGSLVNSAINLAVKYNDFIIASKD